MYVETNRNIGEKLYMNKKRLLFYYKLFFAGGTEHSILNLIRRLYLDFDIYVAYDEEDSTEDVLSEIRKYAQVINLSTIETISVDTCIWCSHSRQGSFKEFTQKVVAKHYIYWCHLVLFETFPKLEFYEDFIENIEKIICVSDVVKNDIISKYPNLKSKCEVIENYLDVQEILQSSMKQVDFKVDSKRLNIISISRVSKEKRI